MRAIQHGGTALDCFASLAMTNQTSSSNRSRQLGFIASMSTSFFVLDPPLICFSRAIASSIVECNSYQTSILHPYRFVKPPMMPVRCCQTLCGKLGVTPTYNVPFLRLAMMYTAACLRMPDYSSSLRGAKRRSNPARRCRTGLLRFARNDDERSDARGRCCGPYHLRAAKCAADNGDDR
jgi:hypothetical protein